MWQSADSFTAGFGLGEKVEIIEPAEMREKYVTYLQKIQNKYS